MLLKIERRVPVNPYIKRQKWRLREHVSVRTLVKYAALTLAGFLLFRAGQAHALAER